MGLGGRDWRLGLGGLRGWDWVGGSDWDSCVVRAVQSRPLVCGEAVHGCRGPCVHGEGRSCVVIGWVV